MGASFALVAADMALAGITSAIPVDQVVDAMYQVGSAMPTAFRETAEGGLAATPKGKALAKEIANKLSVHKSTISRELR